MEKKDELVFEAEFESWKAEKKLSLEGKSEKEVSQILSELREMTSAKAFELMKDEIDFKKIGKIADDYLTGTLNSAKIKKELVNTCKSKEFYPIAESYFLDTIVKR